MKQFGTAPRYVLLLGLCVGGFLLAVGVAGLLAPARGGWGLVPAGDSAGESEGEPGPASRHVVEIRGFEYRPAVLRVSPGDTVVWTNRDVVPHTATATHREWDTGEVAGAGSALVVPIKAGEHPYICIYHPSMKGTLIVR